MNTINVSQLIIQAECYKILALLYHKPESGIHDNKKLCDTLVKSAGMLGSKAFEVSKKFRDTSLKLNMEDLIKEHTRLFGDPGVALAYPCSSRYINKSNTGSVLGSWLTNIYHEAGYDYGQFTDPIDHISTELGFVYHLLSNAAKGFKEDDMSTINHFGELRCLFVREHVINWVPEFTRCVINNSQSPYYLQLAILTRTIIVQCPDNEV